jgi:aryl-alcohol dehydrogenase-like predicted oxidoreductase
VTKVGAKRGPNAEWIQGRSRELLVESVEDNLRNLDVDALDVVNLRGSGLMTPDGSFDGGRDGGAEKAGAAGSSFVRAPKPLNRDAKRT